MGWWRATLIAAAGLGSFLIVKAAPSVLGFLGGKYAVERLTEKTWSPDDLAVQMRANGFRMFDALKQEIPNEFESLAPKLIQAIKEGKTAKQAQEHGFQLIAAARRKYAPRLLEAPDDQLYEIIRAQLSVLELVQSREDALRCTQFAISGPQALGIPDRTYQLALDEAGVALFRAIGAALRNPLPKEVPSEDDWANVVADFLDKGGTEEDFLALANVDPESTSLCGTAIRFYRSLLGVGGESGRRLRAEIAYSVAIE